MARFILAPNTMHNLNFLRAQYQKLKEIDLSNPQPMLSRPAFLGGTDVETRKKQIDFLEKIRTFLKPNMLKEEEISTLEELKASITAARVMIAAILYVKHQINKTYSLRDPKGNSVLYGLLDDDIGITKYNYLDEEDEEICILAAKRIIMNSSSDLEHVNSVLKEAELKELSEKDWSGFKEYLDSKAIKKTKNNPYVNYPVTNITQKLFGTIGFYAGATLGYIGSDIISHSNPGISVKMKFTALIGSSLFVFSSSGPSGVLFFAPAVAERLISVFCSIGLAHMLGTSLAIVGQGIGLIVGIPLDLAYKLIWATCKTITGYSFSSKKPPLTGIRIQDGMTVLCGVPLEPVPEDKLPTKYQQIQVDVREGQLYLNDQLVTVPESGLQLPKEILRSLEQKLKAPPLHEKDGIKSTSTQAEDAEDHTRENTVVFN